MSDLVLYLGVTICGYFVGSRLRSQKDRLHWTGNVQTVAITILVLLMGMRMGANPEITENLKNIGVSAFIITVFTVVFSIIAVVITRRLLGFDKYGNLTKKSKSADGSNAGMAGAVEAVEEIEEEEKKQGMSMMTVAIVVAVLIGMLIGYFAIRKIFAGNMETFDNGAGLGIKIGLCVLLAFVGIDLGVEGTVIGSIKSAGLRILAFPVATIIGTLVGAFIAGLFLKLSLVESLSISAGFGWYTLAPGIIMDAGYLTASAIAFLHNVMRELTSILFIPVVASKIGYIETTCMPGAAAMDVCLPIVEKSTKSDIAVYSFVSGVVLSILVPVFVPLILGALG